MFAELGHFALLLMVVTGIGQAVLFSPLWLRASLRMLSPQRASATPAGSPAFSDDDDNDGTFGQTTVKPTSLFLLPGVILLLGLLAEGALLNAFIVSDFTLPIVSNVSHSSTPLLYRIGAAFTPDGGAMLLWLLALSLVNLLIAIQLRSSVAICTDRFARNALSVLGALITILGVVTLIDADPFLRVTVAPLDGRGMNPQSQDLLKVLREPFLYLGLAGLAGIFAMTLAGLLDRKIDRRFAETMRSWTIISWVCLGTAIAINAYRSYSEQAWGGWWYWDTAENSLLLPWLLATALLHCRAVLEKTETLRAWTAFLGITTLAVGWFGVYLTRSDLFAPLPETQLLPIDSTGLLVAFCLVFAVAYYLFWRSVDQMGDGRGFDVISRESAMFLNSVMLSLVAAVVLIGTIYPLVLQWITGDPITVGAPFYVKALIPIVLPLLFLMAFAPALRWRQDEVWMIGRRMKLAAILSLITVLFVSIRFIDLSPAPLIGIGLAGWVLTASLSDLWARLWRHPEYGESKYRNLQLLGPRYISMTLSHIGLAILIAGGSASSIWEEQVVVSARAGQSIQAGPYNLQYEGVSLLAGENYATRQATFILYRHSLPVTELFPEIRYYPIRGVETREADIWHGRDGDLHVSIGDRDDDGGRVVTVHYLPMMPWVWGGMLLMLIGGCFSILTRVILRFKKTGVPAS
ncbi:heme lyase CcmF/NrfE family subunit [Thalassospira tepidiphila]|uniref:Cytochrome C biogenesis protein CycK n=2 Tax=Thalassospira tepidiphila TaxID=393657 RepID=A0A853L5M3_9PROT|nr:cytochrome c-type biogenesis CcmF C-terminal domain-containing protein [Thalassospira tepidiphila]NJB73794.1 cytochrome c-type biogenesis protein CcmF [Thalassospira tepidiphila]OAZ12031.1 cytochrome C biogenesis protein CycK [Thalassospira tepidiphila MCCC 1A03514]